MASNTIAVEAAIHAAFKDEFDQGGDPTVAYPNVEFTPPDGPWIRFSVLWGAGQMTTGGDGTAGNHVRGVVMANVFDIPGKGTARIFAAADRIRNLFSRTTVGAAKFFAPSGPEPLQPEDNWAGVVIRCPFIAREA